MRKFFEILKGNPYHDPTNGQFTGPGGAALAVAVQSVLDGEKADGFEHAYVYDAQGNKVFTAYGNKTSVTFLPSERAKLRGTTMVHNHPNDSSLSQQDMMLASQVGFTIHAVTKRGDDYWSTGFKEIPDVYRKYEAECTMVIGDLIDARDRGIITSKQGGDLIQHIMNLRAYNKGWIDYQYKLSRETQAEYNAGKDFYEGVVNAS